MFLNSLVRKILIRKIPSRKVHPPPILLEVYSDEAPCRNNFALDRDDDTHSRRETALGRSCMELYVLRKRYIYIDHRPCNNE